jgi:hypothetical protein
MCKRKVLEKINKNNRHKEKLHERQTDRQTDIQNRKEVEVIERIKNV